MSLVQNRKGRIGATVNCYFYNNFDVIVVKHDTSCLIICFSIIRIMYIVARPSQITVYSKTALRG